MHPLLLPLVFVIAPHDARAVAVDVELMLLIDVSGSINDETEYPLQMRGYMDAFNDARVLAARSSTFPGTAPKTMGLTPIPR
jgi:hypothetical protein